MTVEWQQRPIDHWPGELTEARQHAPFKAGWRTTTQLLDRELRMLNAQAVVMLVALDAKNFRIDGQPKANARASHPGVILTFESKFGPLRYACDRFWDFADNVRAIALGLEALRKVERYGITKSGEQYRGFSQLPPGTVMGAQMSKSEAARVLVDLADPDGVTGTSPVDLLTDAGEVDEMFKIAARAHHPDRGGNADLFRRANEARDVLEGANT